MASPASLPPSDSTDPSLNNSSDPQISDPKSPKTLTPIPQSPKNQVFNPQSSAKRPRGRPPGSKNKPKIESLFAVDPSDAFRCHIIEIAPGADVAISLSAFAASRGLCLTVLHAAGAVDGFSLPNVSYKGRYTIVSLHGVLFPDGATPSSLNVVVADSNSPAKVIGGVVCGPLVAAAPVMVTAATFSMPVIDKIAPAAAIVEQGSGSDGNSDPSPVKRLAIKGVGSGSGSGSGFGYNPNLNPNLPVQCIAFMGNCGVNGWAPPQHPQFQHNGRRFFENGNINE